MQLHVHTAGVPCTVAHRVQRAAVARSCSGAAGQPQRISGSSSSSSRSSHRGVLASATLRRPRTRTRLNATPGGADGAGEGEGEVYEVAESEDDLWASIALPVRMTSQEGAQVEYLTLDTDGALVEPAVESYLKQLQSEREAEAAAVQGARDEAASKAGGGDEWSLDPLLLRRMAAVRDAERGVIVQELMYLLCIKKLKDAGLTIVTDLGDAAPLGLTGGGRPAEAKDKGRDTMGRRMEQLQPLVSLPVADSILGYVNAAVTNSMRQLAKYTPLSMDRVQAARLYAGMLEFGYFSRGLESECIRRSISLGSDSATMVQVADSLPEDELKSMCEVQTADGWYTAVRHVGGLFGLRPNPELQFDSAVLPYAELYATIQDIVLEPASSISEHYSPPGATTEMQRRAKQKQERGWQVDPSEAAPELPEADLVSFQAGEFGGLLVEAAVVGCLLWEVEHKVRDEFGYELESKAARAQHLKEGNEGEK